MARRLPLKMADNGVRMYMKQCVTTAFLVKEGPEPLISAEEVKHSTLLKRSDVARHLNGVNFSNMPVVIWFRRTGKYFLDETFQTLVTHWDNCIHVPGQYVEK